MFVIFRSFYGNVSSVYGTNDIKEIGYVGKAMYGVIYVSVITWKSYIIWT